MLVDEEGCDRLDEEYEKDYQRRLVVMAGQLIYTRRLVEDRQLTSLRMAIIASDHAAEIIMHRRCDWLIANGDSQWRLEGRHYTLSERRAIRRLFDEKIRAIREHEDQWPRSLQLLGPTRAQILSLAHEYRNAIYHRDRHYPGFVPALARVQFVAVAEAFGASFDKNAWSVGGRAAHRRQELSALGFQLIGDPDTFNPGEIAEQCSQQLSTGLAVSVEELKAVLMADIVARTNAYLALLEELKRDGAPTDKLARTLANFEFWDVHGEDSTLLRIRGQQAALRDARIAAYGTDPTADLLLDQQNALQEDFNKRWVELSKNFKPSVFDDNVMTNGFAEFQSAESVASVLTAYRDLDHLVEKQERYVTRSAEAWDEYVDLAVQRAKEEGLLNDR